MVALPMIGGAEARAPVQLYDSFDGHLYRDGLQLLAEPGEGGGRQDLYLRRRPDFGVEARARTDQSFPLLADELPTGVLRSRLAPSLGIRALLSLGELRMHRIELVQRDDEDKIRVRLFLEEYRLQDPTRNQARILVRWIRIEALRGYAREARSLGEILARDFALVSGDGDLVRRVHQRLGATPDEQIFRQAPVLTADLRADAAMRTLLGHLLDVIEANEAGAVAHLDTEFLHDLRVAVRRLRALLRQMSRVFSPVILARLTEDFAWLGGVTGPARDLDVTLLEFDGFGALVPPSRRAHLEPLRLYLQYRRQEAYEQLASQLHSRRYRGLKRRLRSYLHGSLPARPRAQDAGRPVGEVARSRTWRIYKRVLREGLAIGPDSTPADLHELRKSCKKLRYLIQSFQDIYSADQVQAAIRELKRLQDNLGEYQDLFVQTLLLEQLPERMRKVGMGDRDTFAAMASLRQQLERRKVKVREAFAACFHDFSREKNQRRYQALFHP